MKRYLEGGYWDTSRRSEMLYKCPACDGWGKRDTYQAAQSTAVPTPVRCPACNGAGVVSDSDPRLIRDIRGSATEVSMRNWALDAARGRLGIAVEALRHIKASEPFPGNNCTTGYHDVCAGCLEMWAEQALRDMGEENWERPEPRT